MTEAAVGKTTDVKTQNDEEIVETFAAKTALEGEKPFFGGGRYSKKLWGSLFRINWFNPATEKIRSSCVSVTDGVIEEKKQ